MNETYVTPKEATKILGVHYMTLKNWEAKGKIKCVRTPGGKRLYNVTDYIKNNNNNENKQIPEIIPNENKIDNNKMNICYCRVSTRNQKDDLVRQIQYMETNYPNHVIISEIASGLNFKRPKLMKIVNWAIEGKINEIVVAHKDRLARFGFELIENIITTYSNGNVVIIDNKEMSPEEEITKDLVSIINVFSARVNGLRKYKKIVKSNV